MAEKKVKEMLEEGLSPSDVLKSIADEEKGENNAKFNQVIYIIYKYLIMSIKKAGKISAFFIFTLTSSIYKIIDKFNYKQRK